MTKIRNRFKFVKGSCYLTHGDDDYDHKALKKALRASERDFIEEGLQDIEDNKVVQTTGKLTYRLVIFTQIYENYGYRMKAKGGNEYHLPIENILTVTSAGLKAMVEAHRSLIERLSGPELHDYDERIVEWGVFSNEELTPDELMDVDDIAGHHIDDLFDEHGDRIDHEQAVFESSMPTIGLNL